MSTLREELLEIHGLVEQRDAGQAANLLRLADAVASADPAVQDQWGRIDITRVLAVDFEATHGRKPAALVALETIRNLLVLAPVAITWWGIGRATGAYRAAVAAEPALREEPFLLLWQTGFDGRVGWWTLHNIARADALLVAIILAMTVAAAVWSHRRERIAAERDTALVSRVRGVLTEAALYFAARRTKLPPDTATVEALTERLESAAREAAAVTVGIEASAAHLSTVRSEFVSTFAQLDGTATQLREAVEALGTVQAQILPAISATMAEVETLVREQGQLASDVRRALHTANEASVTGVEVATALSGSMRELAAANTEFLKGITEERLRHQRHEELVRELTEQVGAAFERMRTEANGARTGLTQTVDQLAALVERQIAAAERSASQATGISDAIKGLQDDVATILATGGRYGT